MNIAAKAIAMVRPRSSARRIGPIGVDLSLEQLHMVQLESSDGRPPHVRARVSLPFDCSRGELVDRPHQFRSLLKQALDRDRFYGKKAVLAMPSGLFRTV